jgi:hypothetical protein
MVHNLNRRVSKESKEEFSLQHFSPDFTEESHDTFEFLLFLLAGFGFAGACLPELDGVSSAL